MEIPMASSDATVLNYIVCQACSGVADVTPDVCIIFSACCWFLRENQHLGRDYWTLRFWCLIYDLTLYLHFKSVM